MSFCKAYFGYEINSKLVHLLTFLCKSIESKIEMSLEYKFIAITYSTLQVS